jgi:hypothetical protein
VLADRAVYRNALEVIAHARPENVVPLRKCQYTHHWKGFGTPYKSTATTILSWLPSSFFLLLPVLLALAPT